MGASNSTSKSIKFYTLKQKAGDKDEDTPNFWLTEKVGDKWQATQSFNCMEGMLNSAKIVEKEFKPGKKTRIFEIEMADDDGNYKVSLPHGNLTYSIINSLATNANSLDKYKITVVKRKSKDGKYWNAQGYINVNGSSDMQKWSIDPQQAPKPVPVMVNGEHFMVNGEKQYDKKDVMLFWEDVFTKQIAGKLSGAGSAKPASSAPTSTGAGNAASSNTSIPDDDMDQLPF